MTGKQRPPLTQRAIVDAAIQVVERDGLSKLSMRNVASELSFEVMSLYTHIKNKDELLTGMVEWVAEQVELPAIDEVFEWRVSIRRNALDLKDLFERHPWSVDLWLRTVPGPHRFDLMEWQLAALATSELSEQRAHIAFHSLFNHTVGFMLQRHAMDLNGRKTSFEELTTWFEPERHTHIAHHMDQHLNGQSGDSFEFVLDLLLESF